MAGRIKPEDIDGLRERADIVEVVSDYVQLKKAGRLFKGLCPFHDEKTPSFMVDPVKQLYHCFGCGEGGNIYTFLMKKEGLEFREAVERLASRLGYQLHYEGLDRSFKKQEGKRERLLRLHRFAAELYQGLLYSEAGRRAREYLSGRGLREDTWKTFSLGYAPAQWDSLYRRAVQKGFSNQEILESGLFIKGEKGIYDRFRDRVIFPIENLQDEVIGFGGRIIDRGDTKYINSPETAIYVKSKNLYNLNRARREIVKEGYALVVEGYTDVICLFQEGVRNVVATLGTALGEEHFRLLSRLTERVILCFDADAAGIGASERGLAFYDQFDLDIRVIQLPGGRDPADFIMGEGKEVFYRLVEESAPLVEFCLEKQLSGYDPQDLATRQRGTLKALNLLVSLKRDLNLDRLLRRVADWASLDYMTVMHYFNRLKRDRARSVSEFRGGADLEPGPVRADIKAERELVKVLLNYPQYIDEYYSWLDVDLFSEPSLKKIIEAMISGYGKWEQAFVKGGYGEEELGEAKGRYVRDLISSLEGEKEKNLAIALLFDQDERKLDPDAIHYQLRELFATLKGFCLERQIRELKRQLERLVSSSPRDHELEKSLAREIHGLEMLKQSAKTREKF
jgi:DNA primase